jgi:hypothetical protein
MKHAVPTIFAVLMLLAPAAMPAAGPVVGAAPSGDATAVATRIIKRDFPRCKSISNASRNPKDGTIKAKCDGTDYLVFTVHNANTGKAREMALECAKAKSLFNVSC